MSDDARTAPRPKPGSAVISMIVAVPMLIVLNAVCAPVPALSGVGALLSDEADEEPSEHTHVMPEEELPETYRGR